MIDIAIVGAGPYGLSVAAHLRGQGIAFRIFGRLMDSWLSHMPKGMSLKSEGFASNISDPQGILPLRKFCAERDIEYADVGIPVRLDTFTAYGLAFKERLVPELEDKLVATLERIEGAFRLRLDDGEIVTARRVVLAVGITHYEYIPERLAHLGPEYVSHSFRHSDVQKFKGSSVVVVGGGSSATDLVAEMYDAGAQVQLVVRQKSLYFHSAPAGKPRSLWKRISRPQSGLGPSMQSALFCKFPTWFRFLPEALRLKIVRSHLGPSGTWFTKDRIVGRVPLQLGTTIECAEVKNDKVHLHVRTSDGATREIVTEHVITATGYRVNLDRLTFLSPELRSKIKAVNGTPVLSSSFESSIPDLYFVGVSAANTFGPMMRFAFGADFAARHLSRRLATVLARNPGVVAAPSPAK
jgi:cation diffusion facilitator CzcD-associated flavoprotein CzcO